MKGKAVKGVSRNPTGLTFSWTRGDEALVRCWSAVLLALGISVAVWFSIRVVVPVSVASDGASAAPAELILLSEDSDPSLLAILSDRSLPSLGVDEGVVDAPMLEGMLSLLGLEAEDERSLSLYPEPVMEPRLSWPREEREALSLPALPEIEKEFWPRIETPEDLEWKVSLQGKGKLAVILKEKILPWQDAVPAIRSSVWAVAFDSDGALAFAGAVDGVDAKIEKQIRKKLARFFEGDLLEASGASGVVELSFERKVN